MNKLELMKTFVRVTELRSFTQAAASLGLPKASVSEHVRDLEQLFGARLLNRTTRKVSVTQDGQALYERCKDMLADMDDMENMFRLDGAVLAGRLRKAAQLAHAHEGLHQFQLVHAGAGLRPAYS